MHAGKEGYGVCRSVVDVASNMAVQTTWHVSRNCSNVADHINRIMGHDAEKVGEAKMPAGGEEGTDL